MAAELAARNFAPCIARAQENKLVSLPLQGASYVPQPHCIARMSSYTPYGNAPDLTRRSFVPPPVSFPSAHSATLSRVDSAPAAPTDSRRHFHPPTPAPIPCGTSNALQRQGSIPQVEAVPDSPTDPHHDLSDKLLEPWLEPEVVKARRTSMGLDVPRVAHFLAKCEVISLGNFCGIARALQAIDVKKKAYPFDWVRSPVDGIIQCFENDFEDFLTFSTVRDDEASKLKVFTGSRWGGAFWHHNPLDPKTKTDFTRRIERLLGLGDIPSCKPRFFVRAVNSTSELRCTLRLKETLQRALPDTSIYLLILIDFQLESGPIRLDGNIGSNIMFYRVHENVFATQPWSMQRTSEAYAEAVVFAADYWSLNDEAQPKVKTVSSLLELGTLCDEFDGGNTGSDGYWPRRFQGQQIRVRKAAKLPGLLAPASAAQRPQEGQQQIAEVRIPEGFAPGDALRAHAFGGDVQVQVPLGASVGQTLKLKLMEGVVTVMVAAAMNASTALETKQATAVA